MKKTLIFIFIIIIFCIGFFFYQNNLKKDDDYSSNYTAEKLSIDTEDNSIVDKHDNNINKNNEGEEISHFSTKLPKDTKARYSNIELACKTLNNAVIKSNDTFSLWNVLGCPTKEKGYKKAKAFTSDGEIKKSYGGGICQVSTTIYNAVLDLKGIKILERHEHSRDVVYIKDGKDAAVSYNSADLKFKNELDYDIRLKAEVEDNKVKIKIEKI